MANLLPFLAGAVAFGFAMSGLGFLRLWWRSRDPLFLAFAAAFWLLLAPPLSAIATLPDEPESWVYIFRLAAFLLIITAILLKNLGRLTGSRHRTPRGR